MSIKVMQMVFDRFPSGGSEMLLALSIANFSNDQGESIFPKVSTLAEMTRQSERTVQRQLQSLQELGWLELVEAGVRGKASMYRINASWVCGDTLSPKVVVTKNEDCGDNCVTLISDKPSLEPSESKSRKGLLPESWFPKPSTVSNLSRELGLCVPEDVDRYVAAFRDICQAKGYKYADFDAAFRNCVRQDWPKIRATLKGSGAEQQVAL